jgi:hypothetical protein
MSLRSLLQRLFEPDDAADLRERVEKIEKAMRDLDVQWTDVYDKFRNLHMRVARRVKVIEEASSQEEPQGAGGEEQDVLLQGQSGMFTSLSPRQAEAQRQILARRRKGGEKWATTRETPDSGAS